MEQEYSLGNLFKNMTRGQKIAVVIILMIIVVLIVLLYMLIRIPEESDQEDNESVASSEITDSDNAVVLADGFSGTILKNENDYNNGNIDDEFITKVPISTKYNKNHEYALIDYLPKGEYKFLTGEESFVDAITYYIIKENTAIDKGIIISVDDCNVEGNKKAANDYLRSLPVDLSEYVIVYQTHTGDVPCEMH